MSTTLASARLRDQSGFPLMERPIIAMTLAAIAGLLNAWTIANTQTFATVQSGNVVSAGYDLVSGNMTGLTRALLSIGAFGLGSFLCAVVVAVLARTRRIYTPWILGVETLILVATVVPAAAASINGIWIACILSFTAGMQGNAFHRDRGMLYGNIAVTFVLQAVFSYLGRAAMVRWYNDGEKHLRPASVYGSVLVGFAAGGAVGCGVNLIWAPASIAFAALATVLLAVAARIERGRIDPDNNAATQ